MFPEDLKYQVTITMITTTCCSCGVSFGMPSDLQAKFKNDPSRSFFCPNGHEQHYATSRQERLLKQAQADLQKKKEELEAYAKRNRQLESQLKKVKTGTCPCCNKAFANLKLHLYRKHPNYLNT